MSHHIHTVSRLPIALAALLAAGGARADCKKVSGRIEFQQVTGPACVSAAGLCATGTVQGGLKGTWDFTGTSLIPSIDTGTTSVLFATADEVFHTADGDILVKSALAVSTTGGGEFASVDVIVGASGTWAGASGTFTTTGVFVVGAIPSATFHGDICTP